jgi:hypothetical protein
MSSFDNATRTLQLTARITHGNDAEARAETFESVREDISLKDLIRMASVYEPELSDFMWNLVVNKITIHVDNTMVRAKALRDKVTEEKNSGVTPSDSVSVETTRSDNPFELFKQAPKKLWGDYLSDDEPLEQPPAKPAKASGPWAHAASPFPPLQRAPASGQAARRMPPGRAPRKAQPVKESKPNGASNWNSDRAKQSSSELFMFGVYTDAELKDPKVRERDWFLWEMDELENPIGWRTPNGWYTSRPKALFRHKKSNTSDAWIHQTFDKDTQSWVTKDHATYVQMMRSSTNHLK